MTTPENFKKKVKQWASEVGVPVKEIHMRDMTNKWASCSAKGRLTFDSSLLNKPPETQDKAILHELLHLRYPNHGRMFKSVLKARLERNQDRPDLP